MWMDITALHVAASYLDPSLKSFPFVKDGKEGKSLLEQSCTEECNAFNDIFFSDDSDTSDLEDVTVTAECIDNESSTKKKKTTLLLNLEMSLLVHNCNRGGHASDFEADVDAEFRRYSSLITFQWGRAYCTER